MMDPRRFGRRLAKAEERVLDGTGHEDGDPVEAPAAGTVHAIAVKEGDTVKEGTLVVVIESD